MKKNSDQKMAPASLTKVATAIYAIERGNLEDIVTISKNARVVEGTRVFLEEGEKVSLRKLIQGLLVNSGNDAGVAIAEYLDGSVKQFSTSINKYLKKLEYKIRILLIPMDYMIQIIKLLHEI